jgi:hypothetical protein
MSVSTEQGLRYLTDIEPGSLVVLREQNKADVDSRCSFTESSNDER